jgi:hypothetical protein
LQPRSIILSVAGAAVLIAFFMVIMDSQGAQTAEVDDAELDKAMSAYKRGTKSGSAAEAPESPATRAKTPRIPKTRARNRPSTSDDSEDSKSEPYTAPAPEVEAQVFDAKTDLKTQMNEANRLYDKADYEGAREAALSVLVNNEFNVRMKRIVVSSSCIMAEEGPAREHFADLPARDQRQMARRCKRYGIEFDEEQ